MLNLRVSSFLSTLPPTPSTARTSSAQRKAKPTPSYLNCALHAKYESATRIRNRALCAAFSDIDHPYEKEFNGYRIPKERWTLFDELTKNQDLQRWTGFQGGVNRLTVDQINTWQQGTVNEHPRNLGQNSVTGLSRKGSGVDEEDYLTQLGFQKPKVKGKQICTE